MDLVALYILEPTAVESSTLVHSNDLKMLIVKKKNERTSSIQGNESTSYAKRDDGTIMCSV